MLAFRKLGAIHIKNKGRVCKHRWNFTKCFVEKKLLSGVVNVIFTTEPQALVSDIANRKDILLGFYWNNAGLKRLAAFKPPVGAWYLTRTRDQYGQSRLEIHDPTDFLNPRCPGHLWLNRYDVSPAFALHRIALRPGALP